MCNWYNLIENAKDSIRNSRLYNDNNSHSLFDELCVKLDMTYFDFKNGYISKEKALHIARHCVMNYNRIMKGLEVIPMVFFPNNSDLDLPESA